MNPTPDPDSASEETPLIVHGRDDAAQLSPNQRHRTRVLVIVILILLIMDWASFLGSAPQLDIFEAIICDRIYREDNTTTLSNAEHAAGRDCTINSVQSELALVTQILSAVSAVPSIFLAIPYGALADRIGRRPVLFVCIIGLLLQDVLIRCITWWPSIFPLWLVWFTPLTTLVGGGSTVASAMLYLAVADVVEERERATWFSQMGVAILAGEIVAAPAASALMQSHGPWLPYLLGTAVIALASPLALFLPETNQVVTAQEGYPARYHAPPKSVGHQFKLAIRRTSQSLGSILNNRNAVLVLLSYFVVAIARNPTLDIQFMRQRFKWKFSSVSSQPAGIHLKS
jgi:MFS family permease